MKIQTSAQNVELTSEVRDYIEKRLSTLDKLTNENDSVFADLVINRDTHHRTGDVFSTEINLQINGDNIYAKTEQESLFASIDIAKDEVARALRNKKNKKETMWRRGGRRVKKMLRGFRF